MRLEIYDPNPVSLPDLARLMRWRLILDPPCSGPENMARDDYCLASALAAGEPILRLYGWEGAVLSVGRNQKVERQIDLAACAELGIPLVRRMTGGRGVLHGGDLTYAVAAPTAGGRFAPGIMAIYKELSQVLLYFFQELGFDPQCKSYSGGERAELASAVCFSTPSAFEILIDGKKVVGSAQRLLPGGFLQHGSIPLESQHETLARIFHDVEAVELQGQMTDLTTLGVWRRLDPGLNQGELAHRLAAAFTNVMRVELEPRPWSGEERKQIAERRGAYDTLELPSTAQTGGAGG